MKDDYIISITKSGIERKLKVIKVVRLDEHKFIIETRKRKLGSILK